MHKVIIKANKLLVGFIISRLLSEPAVTPPLTRTGMQIGLKTPSVYPSMAQASKWSPIPKVIGSGARLCWKIGSIPTVRTTKKDLRICSSLWRNMLPSASWCGRDPITIGGLWAPNCHQHPRSRQSYPTYPGQPH